MATIPMGPTAVETVRGQAPEYRFREIDQTAPAGMYRWIATGDTVELQRATNADWSTQTVVATFGSSGGVTYADDVLLRWGTGNDVAAVLRSTTLGANTALTGVIVGTPVVPAIPANSFILGNVTADGDIVFIAQTGGNSREGFRVDASAGDVVVPDGSSTVNALAFGSGADSRIYYDGTDTFWDLRAVGTGDLMIALAGSFPSPDTGTVHIWSGNAGTVGAQSETVLLVEASTDNSGIEMLTQGSMRNRLSFSSNNATRGGEIRYYHASDTPASTMELVLADTARLRYSPAAFAFQEATTISTTSTNDLTLDPGGQLLLAGGDVFQSSSATEIGISVNNTALTVGSLGSLVVPVKTDTGAPNDAAMGNVVGAFAYNSQDNTLEIRDTTADAPLSVGVAGYIWQRRVPVAASGQGWYHPSQHLEAWPGFVDETRCIICGEQMTPGSQITMWANAWVRGHGDGYKDLHAIAGHLHLERDPQFSSLEERLSALEEVNELLRDRLAQYEPVG